MFPGNVDPRMLKQAMKRMGVQQEEIDATEVIIRTPDKEIIITNPSVSKVKMMGDESWQISGEAIEREISAVPDIDEEDIKTVMDQAGVSGDIARETIQKHNGDLAAAILELKKE
jgi:nascent polypeptide-associated complex subunit alpha